MTATGADLQLSPVKALVAAATAVSCGVDFTVWIADGKAMAAGNPQYGQLGDGSDHAYNSKDSSICMVSDPQAMPKHCKVIGLAQLQFGRFWGDSRTGRLDIPSLSLVDSLIGASC